MIDATACHAGEMEVMMISETQRDERDETKKTLRHRCSAGLLLDFREH